MKKVFVSFVVASSLLIFGCGNSGEKKQDDGAVPHDTTHGVSASVTGDGSAAAYICPCGGCPDVRESQPGKCPKCEMDLVEEKK